VVYLTLWINSRQFLSKSFFRIERKGEIKRETVLVDLERKKMSVKACHLSSFCLTLIIPAIIGKLCLNL